MELQIITPSQSYTVTVNWIEINTKNGNRVIQSGYTPTIFLLSPYKDLSFGLLEGVPTRIHIIQGVLKVRQADAQLIAYIQP